jgi:predicted DNA-binding transcriptional regulator AlpA
VRSILAVAERLAERRMGHLARKRCSEGNMPTFQSRQAERIRELRETLIATGYLRLDEQAGVLGLPRSTTWSIIQAKHKASGLSGSVINQMLAQPQLPKPVRMKILEYVNEKRAGQYGHNPSQVRRFLAALNGAGYDCE